MYKVTVCYNQLGFCDRLLYQCSIHDVLVGQNKLLLCMCTYSSSIHDVLVGQNKLLLCMCTYSTPLVCVHYTETSNRLDSICSLDVPLHETKLPYNSLN